MVRQNGDELYYSGANSFPLKKTIPIKSSSSSTNPVYYRLEFDIKNVFFIDHELINQEEYYSKKIIENYNVYQSKIKSNLLDEYQNELNVSIYHSLKKEKKIQ
jgi:hypothetical protein